jgi:hypothetical protein
MACPQLRGAIAYGNGVCFLMVRSAARRVSNHEA